MSMYVNQLNNLYILLRASYLLALREGGGIWWDAMKQHETAVFTES